MKKVLKKVLQILKAVLVIIRKMIMWGANDPAANVRRNIQSSTSRGYMMNSRAEGEFSTKMKSANINSQLSNADDSGSNYKEI